MSKKQKHVLQFKISLLEVEPSIWRRIQVRSAYSFWDLHVAIQDAMGWFDCNLHEFEVRDPAGEELRLGIPDPDMMDGDVEPEWETPLGEFLSQPGDTALYAYDMGDGWQHAVVLEEILPVVSKQRYPRCLDGARRCPPEDCGGPWGYPGFLEAIGDSKHDEHEQMLEWVGGSFDPEEFDPGQVHFDNPKKRLDFVLTGP